MLKKLYNKGTTGVRLQSEACIRTAKSGFFKSTDYKPDKIPKLKGHIASTLG